jgi:hypothetical protein
MAGIKVGLHTTFCSLDDMNISNIGKMDKIIKQNIKEQSTDFVDI